MVPLFCVCAPEVPSEVDVPVLEPDGDVEEPRLLIEMTAKSILPEVGFRMMSSIRPMVLPELSLTCAFIRLLPRTACWELRPVALSWLLLHELLVSVESGDTSEPLCDEPLCEPDMRELES